MSRLLSDLHPSVQAMAQVFLSGCAAKGLDVLITCTHRTGAEQDALYAQGRTKPGKVVTNAKAGQSSHNFTMGGKPASLAFDIVPLRHGKPVWGISGNGMDDNPADDEKDDLELWQNIRAVAEKAGLSSASRWVKMREWPHFEHPDAAQMRDKS
jgi:peptidoglycan L-alanyl-D-glutamate endopeptidase CwlK